MRATAPVLQQGELVPGRILRRYQRFLADVELPGGEVVTVHTTNTGTMKTCWEPGDLVLLRPADNPARKLKWTWVACRRGEAWIGVETGIPNKVVAEAARRGLLPGLEDLREVRTEVRYGQESSRIDVHARDGAGREVFIEVKNATLRMGSLCTFPDAVTTRGLKHLRELTQMVREGHRAVILFFVHRPDVAAFQAAWAVDPAYGAGLEEAAAAGVEVLPLAGAPEAWEAGDGTWSLAWPPGRRLPWILRGSAGDL